MLLQRIRTAVPALLAALAVLAALWHLFQAQAGVDIAPLRIGAIPATLYRPTGNAAAPVVVIAHGFAGSQQLMQSFALTCARNGYFAVTFDFPGHGRNPAPLSGDITSVDGATRRLLADLATVGRAARALGDGRLAVLGHSMASDIVVRYASQVPAVAATVAVSLYSPAVTAQQPPNLLVIVGGWEGMLGREALRAVGLATAPERPLPQVTYGDFRLGTARRASFSAGTEHLSVLFSQDSQREALAWLDQSFGRRRTAPPQIDGRGPSILLLIAGLVLLARPLAALLPRCATPALGASLPWRRLVFPLLLPMVLTPLVLRVVPTHFLPVLVGDYLAVHFALYGLLTLACLRWPGRRSGPQHSPAGRVPSRRWRSTLAASLAVVGYTFAALVWPINTFFTNFVPGPERLPLILAMLAGTLPYVLADGWMTGGTQAGRGAAAASKVALLVSLGLAVALDFQRLFFLILILPMIVLFFLVFGLLNRWVVRRTGDPLVGGVACAVMLAWAIGVTFPVMAG